MGTNSDYTQALPLSAGLAVLTPATSSLHEPVHDPFRVPHYLWLCEAIERFTAAWVAADRGVFRVPGAQLRHVVERHLFFSLINDAPLYRHFVASEQGIRRQVAEPLSELASLMVPFMPRAAQKPHKTYKSIRDRFVRFLYRREGRGIVQSAGLSAPPALLFHVIHPKFVRYFRPIAQAASAPTAFLAIDDPHMYQWLEAESLPRVSIELTSESVELTKRSVKVGRYDYEAGSFDFLAIRFNAVRHALQSLRPSCIVVAEGNAPNCELVNQAALTLSIPVVCVQQGWAPVVHNGFRRMSFSAFCAWGQGFVDLLAPYNPKQRFVATGNHVVSCRRLEDEPDRCAVGFFLQRGHHLMTEAAWSRMFELILWSATSFPEIEIRVREHPSSPLLPAELARLEGLPNIRLMAPDGASLSQTLAGCLIVVAMDSTTLLEGAATGAVPLILNVNGMDHYSPNIAADGAAIEVQDFAAARSALSKLIGDGQYRRSFAPALDRLRQRFFARDQDEALAAIVAEIEAPAVKRKWPRRQR